MGAHVMLLEALLAEKVSYINTVLSFLEKKNLL